MEYLDEIYNSYKNDIFKIDNISNSLFLDSFDKFLYGLTKKENICFDSIINSIEYCLNGNFLFSNMVYSFFSNIGGSLSTFESDYYNDFAISCLQNNIIYKPVMIYIQYYIIKLSYIVNQDELSKIEWLLIKKILLIFITCKIEIKITDLCQIILIDYLNFQKEISQFNFLDRNLPLHIFIIYKI